LRVDGNIAPDALAYPNQRGRLRGIGITSSTF
jgi:hypothetical protein